MKQFSLFMLLLGNLTFSSAQNNIGIGTQTPHASALLDVSSTSKGLLAPRMTTTQRNAIVSPAKGLLVYDTDLNGLYHYNGSAWAAVGGGGGSFSLPFEANVNLNVPTFQIQNAGSGDVLFLGAGAGSAINAFNTGNAAAISVSAINGFGVYAQSFNSIPVFALSNNSANTLPAMRANNTGGGVGLHATASNNNGIHGVSNSSMGNKSGVRGDATGTGGVGVYGETTSATGVGVAGFNPDGTGVRGISTSGYGVYGRTSTGIGFSAVYGENIGTTGTGVRGVANFPIGIGVYGSSTTGTGVSGASTSGAGVRASSETNNALQAQSNSGTALWGSSTSGYALETSGKVKIAGGNTNPSAGAVLTSVDASGNAVWKPQQVAFRAFGVRTSQTPIYNQWKRVHYALEDFDFGNNFNILTNDNPDNNASVFTAPVSGVYQFSVSAYVRGVFGGDIGYASLLMRMGRNGANTNLFETLGYDTYTNAAIDAYDEATFAGSVTVKLVAGDKIWVELQILGTEAFIVNDVSNVFSGHLVFAD
jgi:hypothetical protein